MTTSARLRYDVDYLYTLISGTREWLLEHELESVAEIRGWMGQGRVPEPTAFANYIRMVQSWKHRNLQICLRAAVAVL